MKMSATLNGGDAFLRRLAAIEETAGDGAVLDEAVAIATRSLREAIAGEGWRGFSPEIGTEATGDRRRDITVAGDGLWAFEFGTAARAGTGALTRAMRAAKASVKAALERGARRAVARTGRTTT